MPMLTEIACRKAQRGASPRKMHDTSGLYLLLHPNGSKYWRQDYRWLGKRRTASHGVYPTVGLADARERAEELRRRLAADIDPADEKRRERLMREAARENTFEAVAREWMSKEAGRWVESHAAKQLARFEANVFPFIGQMPITQLDAPQLLVVLRRVEARGAADTARRIRQSMSSIFRYAIATSRATRDPAADLSGAIAVPIARRFPTLIEPAQIGELLRAIDTYAGGFAVRIALRLMPMLFVRPSELREARWTEFDLDSATWRIPPERRKLRKASKLDPHTPDHIVPLASQAVDLLKELHQLSGSSEFLFPSVKRWTRPISQNTLNAALHSLGFEIVGHGFRHMASTLLHEEGWASELIEMQLAHQDPNEVRARYNLAKYIDERSRMMQAWADKLDAFKHAQQAGSAEIFRMRTSRAA